MNRIVSWVLVALLLPVGALAAPGVDVERHTPRVTSFAITLDSTTDDSPALEVPPGRSCSATFVIGGGGGTVVVTQVPTSGTAGSAGTVMATFTATSTTATTFIPGQRFLKVRATSASPESEVRIACSNVHGSTGSGVGAIGDFDALPADGSTVGTYLVTDCADATCAADGSNVHVLKYWDGSAWANVDTAGAGTVTNPLTADIDPGGFSFLNGAAGRFFVENTLGEIVSDHSANMPTLGSNEVWPVGGVGIGAQGFLFEGAAGDDHEGILKHCVNCGTWAQDYIWELPGVSGAFVLSNNVGALYFDGLTGFDTTTITVPDAGGTLVVEDSSPVWTGDHNFSGATLELPAVSSEGTCTSAQRGLIELVEGGAGVADETVICAKSAADTYSWVATPDGTTIHCESGGLTSPNNTDRVAPGLPHAITITGLYCTVGGTTPSISLALEECDSAGATCVDGGISVTCDGGVDSDLTFTDAAFDAGDAWHFNTGVASGTVDYLAWRVCYSRQVVE